MIDSYHFGQIVIDKKVYKNDVIVFPDHVQGDWWRLEAHQLQMEDIEGVLKDMQPNSLVVGTGQFGIMKVSQDVRDYCRQRDIQLVIEPTNKAVKVYNRLILTDDKVLGAFHLTC